MVPERLAGPGSKSSRGARIPPHNKHATRRAKGLEASLVDNGPLEITSLDPKDDRRHDVLVAGPASLIVAKAHKIGERSQTSPDRLVDKDAHDLYRILTATATDELAATLHQLRNDDLASEVTEEAIAFVQSLFANGPDATGSMMAGRAEEGIGEPETVSAATANLSADLLEALDD